MKKTCSLILLAAALASVSCQKEFNAPAESEKAGNQVVISADINAVSSDKEETRTTLNGLEVNWEEGDVLYLVTSDGTWGKPYTDDMDCKTIAKYTYSDGQFSSDATIKDGKYEFRAMYIRDDQKSYHRGASSSAKLLDVQTQDCSKPTAHIKENDVLAGKFEATVPQVSASSVAMNHIFTIMRVDVKNATGAAVELKKFEMEASGADLAGVFNVDYSKTPICISGKSGQSSKITVNLSTGSVAAGESLPVYFVMAPLSAYSGNVTLKVTDSNDKVYAKTASLTNVSFEAGKLNTTPYTIKDGAEKTSYDWDLSVDSTTEATADKIAWGNDAADMVCDKASSNTNANNYYPGSTGKYSSTRFYKDSKLTITPKAGKSLTYYAFTATSESYADALKKSVWTNVASVDKVNQSLVYVKANDPTAPVSAVISAACGFVKVECHTDALSPIISADMTSLRVPAAGDVMTIAYSVKFPVSGVSLAASSDASWVHDFDLSEDGKVSFLVDENTESAERKAVIRLSYEGADDVVINVTQALKSSETAYLYTFTSKDWKTDDTECKWTGTQDGNSKEDRGVQILGNKNVTVTSSKSFTKVKKIVVTYGTTKSGEGTINVSVGDVSGTAQSVAINKKDETLTYELSGGSGIVKLNVNCTNKSIYIKSIEIFAE